jgi:hypothetical protein
LVCIKLMSMIAARHMKPSITTCAGGCLHLCARECVHACVDQFRARVHVGAWVDAGLCVPMTVSSAANAIAAILKFDSFSGRTADLRMHAPPLTKLTVHFARCGDYWP